MSYFAFNIVFDDGMVLLDARASAWIPFRLVIITMADTTNKNGGRSER